MVGNRSVVLVVCLCVVGIAQCATIMEQLLFGNKINDVEKIQTTKEPIRHRDCQSRWDAGERTAGVYTIYPNGTHPMETFCGHTEKNTFTVIQRRYNGAVSFKRGWYDYRVGFGHSQGDYWAGLDNIHYLTNSGNTIMRMDLQDWNGQKKYIQYGHFSIRDATDRYRLTIAQATGTVAYDDMATCNGMPFATFDYPDQYSCAVNMGAGWWYNYCAYTLPNGHYYAGGPYTPPGAYYDGVFYKDWLGYNYSLKFVTIVLYHV